MYLITYLCGLVFSANIVFPADTFLIKADEIFQITSGTGNQFLVRGSLPSASFAIN